MVVFSCHSFIYKKKIPLFFSFFCFAHAKYSAPFALIADADIFHFCFLVFCNSKKKFYLIEKFDQVSCGSCGAELEWMVYDCQKSKFGVNVDVVKLNEDN